MLLSHGGERTVPQCDTSPGAMTVETTNPGSYAKMEGALLSCEDMEFQAEWEVVTVIPNFQGEKLAMICVRSPPASRPLSRLPRYARALPKLQPHLCSFEIAG